MTAATSASGERWFDQVNACGVMQVARALGFAEVRGHGRHPALAPCPACKAQARGSTDKSGPVGVTSDGKGWRCFRCDASGDAVALAVAYVTGSTDAGGRWADVRRECASSGLCDPDPRQPMPATPAKRVEPLPPPAPEPPRYPPAAEVAALWKACVPVTDDVEVAAWLLDVRRIDPVKVEDFRLARALPRNAKVPRWAWGPKGNEEHGGTWTALGYRLLVPLYDAAGRMASIRARRVFIHGQEPQDGRPKGVAPAGFDVRGLVMADALGRLMLAGAALGDGSPARDWAARCGVWITEGEPDMLALCVQYSDADQDAPAVLSIVRGSWTPEIAARVPDGTTVYLATDHDKDGEKYAAEVQATLVERQQAGLIKVRRWKP